MIRREFHNERRRISREQLRLLQDYARADNSPNPHEVRARRNPGRPVKERSRNQGDNRQFRAAGDEGGRHDQRIAKMMAYERDE